MTHHLHVQLDTEAELPHVHPLLRLDNDLKACQLGDDVEVRAAPRDFGVAQVEPPTSHVRDRAPVGPRCGAICEFGGAQDDDLLDVVGVLVPTAQVGGVTGSSTVKRQWCHTMARVSRPPQRTRCPSDIG